jgi:hypothetical protein
LKETQPAGRAYRTEDKIMNKWHNAGRFLSEFLALGTLFVSAYISMMLI